jgi:hypothetical protein
MLRIRNKQLDVFRDDALARFVRRTVEFVARDYPSAGEALGPRGVEALVHRTIAFGAAHRIETEAGVTALLALQVQYGEAFKWSPDRDWATKVLEHATLPGSLKVEMLVERLGRRSQGRVIVLQSES